MKIGYKHYDNYTMDSGTNTNQTLDIYAGDPPQWIEDELTSNPTQHVSDTHTTGTDISCDGDTTAYIDDGDYKFDGEAFYYNPSSLIEQHDGIYCAICGTKTYLSDDGSHRRCPNCDDKPQEPIPYAPYIVPNDTSDWDHTDPINKWIITCSD